MSDVDDAISQVESEDLDQAADDIEDADVSSEQRFTATAYLIALYLTIGAGLVAAIYFGYIDPYIELTATASVGWALEYLVGGLVAIFLVFTGAMVLVALPVSISAALVRFAAGIAESGSNDE